MVRFHPQWRRAREIVRSGEIGEVGAIQTLFTYRLLDGANIRNKPPGGGGLYDIGCYAILTARYIFGAEPIARRRRARRSTPISAPIGWRARILEFPGGRHLTFSASTQLAGHQRVTIAGTLGADRGSDPVQRADRPADEDHRRLRRRSRRRRARGSRNSRPATNIRCRATRSRARFGRRAARVSDRGRHREHARASTPASVPRGGALGEALRATRPVIPCLARRSRPVAKTKGTDLARPPLRIVILGARPVLAYFDRRRRCWPRPICLASAERALA